MIRPLAQYGRWSRDEDSCHTPALSVSNMAPLSHGARGRLAQALGFLRSFQLLSFFHFFSVYEKIIQETLFQSDPHTVWEY